MFTFLQKYSTYYTSAGRVLVGVFFFLAGVQKLMGIEGVAGYIASVGLPMPTILAWTAAIFLVVVGGSLIIGYQTQCMALWLAAYTILVTYLFHGPQLWDTDSTAQMQFMKNAAILGGLLTIAGKR